MPHYLITVTLKDEQKLCGIRYSEEYNIEKAWQLFEAKAISTTQGLKSFDLMMISKRSKIYKDWLVVQQKRRNPGTDLNSFGNVYEKEKGENRYSLAKKSDTANNWGMNGNQHT